MNSNQVESEYPKWHIYGPGCTLMIVVISGISFIVLSFSPGMTMWTLCVGLVLGVSIVVMSYFLSYAEQHPRKD